MDSSAVFDESELLSVLVALVDRYSKCCQEPHQSPGHTHGAATGVSDEDISPHLEQQCCDVWDLAAREDVAVFLASKKCLELICLVVHRTRKPGRMTEICMGIAANLFTHRRVVDEFLSNHSSVNELLEVTFLLLPSDDAPTLKEVFRMYTHLLMVRNSRDFRWVANHIAHEAVIHQAIFVLQNSLKPFLIEQVCDFFSQLVVTHFEFRRLASQLAAAAEAGGQQGSSGGGNGDAAMGEVEEGADKGGDTAKDYPNLSRLPYHLEQKELLHACVTRLEDLLDKGPSMSLEEEGPAEGDEDEELVEYLTRPSEVAVAALLRCLDNYFCLTRCPPRVAEKLVRLCYQAFIRSGAGSSDLKLTSTVLLLTIFGECDDDAITDDQQQQQQGASSAASAAAGGEGSMADSGEAKREARKGMMDAQKALRELVRKAGEELVESLCLLRSEVNDADANLALLNVLQHCDPSHLEDYRAEITEIFKRIEEPKPQGVSGPDHRAVLNQAFMDRYHAAASGQSGQESAPAAVREQTGGERLGGQGGQEDVQMT
ncbi:unnamed protein product [Vitrella brassicaformis CCMP3155]|uniref:Uncharacterized protein n=2 Tax=Vitrella brassicaformis TaxID=1169539 RepID=A0A0G4GUN7_VITBC|nr:unnamed protein product [Vitrella brassicaformis CCMP3155]|eukprot:CEM34558.1 unnamed protein product [Vitrella brassicaformis CCMP3155]